MANWGFKWGEVISGGGTLLVCGGIAVVGWMNGYFIPWAIAGGVIGACILISGLMGEEGVW